MKYIYTPEDLERMRRCPYLTDKERKVLKLFYFRGWSIEDIAAEMDVSRATINNHLRHLRAKTRLPH